MRLIIPILLAVLGTGAGVGAGLTLRADHAKPVTTSPCGPDADKDGHAADSSAGYSSADGADKTDKGAEYVKLSNQFVVSVVEDGDIAALVVMSLSVEVQPGQKEAVFASEPKLRDVFLQVMFEHANTGGFSGDFTRSDKMLVLQDALLEVARRTLGPVVKTVLIQDLVRQDL